jgi:hypothetical protein
MMANRFISIWIIKRSTKYTRRSGSSWRDPEFLRHRLLLLGVADEAVLGCCARSTKALPRTSGDLFETADAVESKANPMTTSSRDELKDKLDVPFGF